MSSALSEITFWLCGSGYSPAHRGKPSTIFVIAAQPPWVAMWSITIAGIAPSLTIRVETEVARSVRARPAPNGWPNGKPNCCRWSISTWSLLCPPRSPSWLYRMPFRAMAETLLAIAADPKHLGAAIGFLAVLHSWGQTLHLHPHIHCVVPGGGISPDNSRWIPCRRYRKSFFLPGKVLSRRFRK